MDGRAPPKVSESKGSQPQRWTSLASSETPSAFGHCPRCSFKIARLKATWCSAPIAAAAAAAAKSKAKTASASLSCTDILILLHIFLPSLWPQRWSATRSPVRWCSTVDQWATVTVSSDRVLWAGYEEADCKAFRALLHAPRQLARRTGEAG